MTPRGVPWRFKSEGLTEMTYCKENIGVRDDSVSERGGSWQSRKLTVDQEVGGSSPPSCTRIAHQEVGGSSPPSCTR